MTPTLDFIRRHYRHFNAAAVRDATEGFIEHLEGGGKMFLTLAGAMSTAELGLSLAPLIRKGLVHGISLADPIAWTAATAAMVAVATAACLLPARRAARVDPIEALHHQ